MTLTKLNLLHDYTLRCVRNIGGRSKINYNFYQEKASATTGARGGKNWTKNEKKTSIRNYLVKNTTHRDIDEKTNDNVYKLIRGHLLIKD